VNSAPIVLSTDGIVHVLVYVFARVLLLLLQQLLLLEQSCTAGMKVSLSVMEVRGRHDHREGATAARME
jgi:hypothetical protein